MPLARIITSQPGPDEDQLKQQLQAAGYRVEVVAPGQGGSRAADLDIDLEYLTPAQALEAAARMADDGADVFIAPGVVRPQPAPEAVWHGSPARESQVEEPIQAPVPESPAVVAMDTAPQSAPETVWHGSPTGESAESQTLTEAPEPPAPSLFQRVGAAWAERQQRAEERRQERERLAHEEQERRRQQAFELQSRREQEERARADRERREREQMTREAVLRAERARQIEQSERRRAAEVPRQALRPVQAPDAQRLAAMEAQMQAAPAPPKPPATKPPAPVTPSVTARPAPSPAVAPRPPARPMPSPQRRIVSPRQRQWQRATLLASLVALMAMLGFAAAVNLRPGAPLPENILQNNAQQKVPFGPATITPAPMTAASAPAAPARVTALSPVRKPAPRPSAARQKPVHHQPPPRARRSGNHLVAQDEVVVRHYPAAGATSQRTQTSGVRRYSDEN